MNCGTKDCLNVPIEIKNEIRSFKKLSKHRLKPTSMTEVQS